MQFGLKEDVIKAIEQVLAQFPQVDKAIVFGSRAKGNYKEGSDIDLALRGDLTAKDLLDIYEKLEELNLVYKFDLVNYDGIDEPALKEHVDRVGVEMYSRWKTFRLEDLGEILNHKRVPLSSLERNKRQGIYPYYGASGIIDHVDDFLFEGEHVLISEDGENLKTRQTPIAFLADGKFWVNNHAHIVRGKEPFLNRLIIYYFQNLDLSPYLTGAVQPKLNKATLTSIPVYLPNSRTEQKHITEVLSSINDKIDLLNRQNKTLEQLAETLFRQWFVEEAEEGWEEDVLDRYVSFDPREKIDRNKEYQFFEMKCLSNVDMNISDGVYRLASSGSSFRNYDTLLAKITPCLENGKTGFVMHLGDDEVARGSTEFIVMRSKGLVSPYWIYCLARDSDFREKAIQSMTGTSGRQRVQIDLLKNIIVKVDSERMKEFHDIVSPFFVKIKSNQIQVKTLTTLRDTLLPKLMSGEVRLNLLMT